MSRKGTNVYKRKDGRWEGRYVKGYDISGKRVLGFVYGKTYKEALEKRIRHRQNVKSFLFPMRTCCLQRLQGNGIKKKK